MTKQIYDLPKTETIAYFDEAEWNKDLTIEEFEQQELINASYWGEIKAQEKGYGPCRSTLCGCFCSKNECDCNNPEFSLYRSGDWKIGNGNASGSTGLGGNSISGDVDFTLCRKTESNGEMKFGVLSAGAGAVNGGLGAQVRASANLIDFKGDGIEAKVGINLDTGGAITSDGLTLKVAGFGFTIGEKLEISTIVGSVTCVVQ